MAEWPNAAVLKTAVLHGTGGSNPSSSVLFFMINKNETVERLVNGEVVVVPTDTVYGIAALVNSREAVEMIYKLKGRGHDKPLVILGANREMLDQFVMQWGEVDWPGAVTLVVKCKKVPEWVNGGLDTVGLRVPDHDGLRAVLEIVGPVVATSANVSGDDAEDFFGLEIMEGVCGSGVASKVIRWDGKILRNLYSK
jgi:tRNA threonylcarbamoyl adenosine modification protein (Sua5/YciO/YrdC/YwlC family)